MPLPSKATAGARARHSSPPAGTAQRRNANPPRPNRSKVNAKLNNH